MSLAAESAPDGLVVEGARIDLIERQRALDEDPEFVTRVTRGEAGRHYRRRRWRTFGTLLIGFLIGIVTLIAVALIFASRS